MKKTITLLVVLLIFVFKIFSLNTYYESGDTAFSFNIGLSFPLYVAFTNEQAFPNTQEPNIKSSQTETHLSIGGYGALSYQGFINKYLAIGGEAAYSFNYVIDNTLLTQIPLTAKLSYYPIQLGNFDLILHLNAGIVILKQQNLRMVAPQLSISLNPVFYITESWGLGINTGLWTNFELYTSSAKGSKSNENAIGGFLPLTLSLIYRH